MAARKKTARKKPARKAARKKAVAKKATRKAPAKSRKAAAKPSKAAAKPAKKAPAKRKAASKKKSARKGAAHTTSVRRKQGSTTDATAFPEIEALAELMEKHSLHEVSYTREADGSTSLHVSKGGVTMMPASAPMHAAPAAPAAAPSAPAADAGEAAPAAAPAADETLHAFKSPMVGTFYRAPSPEASPFSTTGDSVDPTSVVCIIEAMKVMNEINPDIAGEIVSIEVENGEAVEFGQTLMLLRPR